MVITSKRLKDKEQTGKQMHRMVKQYSGDLKNIYVKKNGSFVPFSSLNVFEAFDFVRRIPYRRDTKPIEVVARPYIIVRNIPLGMDCKKKAVLLSSYLRQRGIPFRLIASSRKKNRRIHHVFPQMGFGGNWLNYDATYSHYRPFERKRITKAEVLT